MRWAGDGPRSHPAMGTVDRRPPPCGFREGLVGSGDGLSPPLRDDLCCEGLASAMGCATARRTPDDAASFLVAGSAVWMASDGWQGRSLDPATGWHVGPRRVYDWRGTSLLAALLGEAPRLPPPPGGRS